MSGVTEERVSLGRRGQGHALEAQPAKVCSCPSPWLSPHGTLLLSGDSLSLPHCGLWFSQPLCPGSLASAVSLIRAPQPLQQGVEVPGPGMAPDKQLEPWVAESVISKGKAETNHQSQGDG